MKQSGSGKAQELPAQCVVARCIGVLHRRLHRTTSESGQHRVPRIGKAASHPFDVSSFRRSLFARAAPPMGYPHANVHSRLLWSDAVDSRPSVLDMCREKVCACSKVCANLIAIERVRLHLFVDPARESTSLASLRGGTGD